MFHELQFVQVSWLKGQRNPIEPTVRPWVGGCCGSWCWIWRKNRYLAELVNWASSTTETAGVPQDSWYVEFVHLNILFFSYVYIRMCIIIRTNIIRRKIVIIIIIRRTIFSVYIYIFIYSFLFSSLVLLFVWLLWLLSVYGLCDFTMLCLSIYLSNLI